MNIQKYKAKIKHTDTEIIGYIAEIRQYDNYGSYTGGVDYLMTVTELSMTNGKYGTWKVDKDSIKTIVDEVYNIPFVSNINMSQADAKAICKEYHRQGKDIELIVNNERVMASELWRFD